VPQFYLELVVMLLKGQKVPDERPRPSETKGLEALQHSIL
jgi:hypothetical protein